MTMNPIELKGALEAIIYAADEPATLDQIANAVGEDKAIVRAALDEMIAGYAGEDRGMEIRGVAGSPVDIDISAGINDTLKNYPGMKKVE